MKFCSKCGKQIEDTDMFCGYCGTNQQTSSSYSNYENVPAKTSTHLFFNNIGKKIKTISVVVTWIGIIAYCILGIVMMDQESFIAGFLIAIAGSFISWLSSLVLYGFGHLIENTDKIIENQNKNN